MNNAEPSDQIGNKKPISRFLVAVIRDKKFRFLLVGGINTIWGILSFPLIYVLLESMKFHYLVILTLTYFVNTILSYSTQKKFVFQTHGNIAREFIKFSSLQVVFFFINLVILPIFVEIFFVDPRLAQTGFAVLLAAMSFLFHERVTFKSRNKP